MAWTSPPSIDLPPRAELEAQCPELAGKFVLLFFSRVHVKKGLDLLAEALSQVAPVFPELHLVIAGNDDGALSPFCDRMAELGLTRRMTYLGHVAGGRARQVWAAADAFILPSYSEGFSMAILEAMACRLPCLITTSCHFPEAAAAAGGRRRQPRLRCGYPRVARATGTDERRAHRLGQNGRQLVEAHYTWDRQAERLAAVYDWLSGGGAPPEPVIH